jgi:hypothetical protein
MAICDRGTVNDTTRLFHVAGWHRPGAWLLILALALGACSAANSPATPSASTAGSSAATSSSPTLSASPSQSAVATPSVGPVTASLAATNQPQTIHLILHPVNDTVGSLTGCSSPGSCQGDFMAGYDPLVDAETGKEVGTFAYECFLVDVASTLYHCPGVTITLTGRGQIVFTELIEHLPGKPPAVSPITGGTGEFLGATGTVTAKVLSGAGDFVIAITR